jgi:hypothetical protein
MMRLPVLLGLFVYFFVVHRVTMANNLEVLKQMCPNSGFPESIETKRGVVMCGCEKLRLDVIKMLYQNRYFWCSKLGVAIAHCSELSEGTKRHFLSIDPSIKFVDICRNNHRIANFPGRARERLKGFFCKLQALLLSPFDETMLLDVDVVWFKMPDLLFNSPQYKQTGTLFFRDRLFYPRPGTPDHEAYHRYDEIDKFFKRHNVSMDMETTKKMAYGHGVPQFWVQQLQILEGKRNKSFTPYDYGESSVTLMDKRTHPKTLAIIEKEHPNYEIGYGDKEAYWLAATAAREPFSFTPYLAGQYGDCQGPVFHYDPSEPEDRTTPYYANAGKTVDEHKFIGDRMYYAVTLPVKASVDNRYTWEDYRWLKECTTSSEDERKGKYSAICEGFKCAPAPDEMHQYLLHMQWLTFTLRMHRGGSPERTCVTVNSNWLPQLQQVFALNVTTKPSYCSIAGCPFIPMTNASLDSIRNPKTHMSGRRYCEPVAFSNNSDKGVAAVLQDLAEKRRGGGAGGPLPNHEQPRHHRPPIKRPH